MNDTISVAAVNSKLARAIPYTSFDNELNIRLDVEASKLLKKNVWRVLDSFKFYIGDKDDQRWAHVPAGFLTDGATIPRILWWLLPPWDTYSQAAALHDYLCEYKTVYEKGQAVSVDRKEADRIFKSAMKASGVGVWPRQAMYVAVRLWAKFGKRPNPYVVDLKRRLDADWEFSEVVVPPEPAQAA